MILTFGQLVAIVFDKMVNLAASNISWWACKQIISLPLLIWQLKWGSESDLCLIITNNILNNNYTSNYAINHKQ